MYKFSVITNFLGEIRNRFMLYQENRTLPVKFQMAKSINGIQGVELAYPQDFGDFELLKKLLKDNNLGVSAVNFRSRRNGQWFRGSFTSAHVKDQQEVVEDMKKCIDRAKELGCSRVHTCPLNEGSDYIFELNYWNAYDSIARTIREVAEYADKTAKDIKICLEYKYSEPRARCLLGNAGEMVAFCQEVGMDNVGITLDFGHSIQAGERPGQAVALVSRAKRLFYVHLNDNDKAWDWDMIPGAMNFWDNIEFFYYLKKSGYNDWMAFDVYPKETDTVEIFNSVTNATKKLIEITDRIDVEKMEELLILRNAAKTMNYLFSIV